MGLSDSNIKRFIIFSYISESGNPEKNSLYLRRQKP